MATPLRMPDLGTVEGDVVLVRWLKAEGDAVALGEPLFEVETDKGPASFYLRWSQDRAVDYGQRGKVLISLENNRYLIPDLEKLTPSERTEFQRYIYW